jgi:hypothetical protein
MSGSGRGGSNRRNRHRFSGRKDEAQKSEKKPIDNPLNEGKSEVNWHSKETSLQDKQERLLWTAPVMPDNPITTPNCPWCGKQITDITTAISDKDTGLPVHFDCVLARITGMETLEPNDSVCYIGGGRFGIVHYNNPPDTRDFTIKKIFEWEVKENISEWRRPISEYFSIT